MHWIRYYCVGQSNVDAETLIPQVFSHMESLDFNVHIYKYNVFWCEYSTWNSETQKETIREYTEPLMDG